MVITVQPKKKAMLFLPPQFFIISAATTPKEAPQEALSSLLKATASATAEQTKEHKEAPKRAKYSALQAKHQEHIQKL